MNHRIPGRAWKLLWPCLLSIFLQGNIGPQRVNPSGGVLVICSHSHETRPWAYLEPVAAPAIDRLPLNTWVEVGWVFWMLP